MAIICAGADDHAGTQAPRLNPNRVNEVIAANIPVPEPALNGDRRLWNGSSDCATATPVSSRWLNAITLAFRELLDAAGVCEPTDDSNDWLRDAVLAIAGGSAPLTINYSQMAAEATPLGFITSATLIPFFNLIKTTQVSIGLGAGSANATAVVNETALGVEAANLNTGDDVTAIGYQAAKGNTIDGQTAVGSLALENATAAAVAVGLSAGRNTTGTGTFIGGFAGINNTGDLCTAIGGNAASGNSGVALTAIGAQSAQSNSGINVTAAGYNSAENNTGDNATLLGRAAGQNNIGDDSTIIGSAAGLSNASFRATFVGRGTGAASSGDSPSGCGAGALQSNSGDFATADGTYALAFNSGNACTAIGYRAGETNEGASNTFVGSLAKRAFVPATAVNVTSITPGSNTMVVGSTALIGSIGTKKVVQITGAPAPLPFVSGDFAAVMVTNSTTLTLVNGVFDTAGTTVQVASNNNAAITDATALGANSVVTASHEVQLGSATTTMVRSSGDATFNAILTPSDRNLKTNIEPIQNACELLGRIDGVYYDWAPNPHSKGFNPDAASNKGRQVGLISQDVQKAFPEAVYDDGGILMLNYQRLVGPLISAVNELTRRLEMLEAK